MAFGNQFHMPGSFHFEGPGASTTLNANMFRPPLSPSSSSYNLAKSTGSLLSDTSMATGSNAPVPARLGRKRTHDESNNRYPFSRPDLGGARDSPGIMDDSARSENRYALAGQIETPGAQITPGARAMDDSLYSDIDYRRALGPKRPLEEGEVGLTRLVNEETGQSITPREAGWTTFAFQAIGGVVGKVWEFCRGGAGSFRGFQAGGGKAFEFNGQPIPVLVPEPHSAVNTDRQDPPNSPPGAYPVSNEASYFSNHHSAEAQETTGMPSYLQEERMHDEPDVAPNPFATPNPFQERQPSPETTPDRPAPKRRQTGHHSEADELRRNWVMVEEDEPSSVPARPTSVARKASSSRIPAAASRSSMASRIQSPRFATPHHHHARHISAPSPRFHERSSIPTRAPSRLHSPASFAGGAASPSLHAREPASYASPRSPSRTAAPNPFATPAGSRIPQPKSATNPFANTRTTSPATTAAAPSPRICTSSRPSSRGSLHPSPLAPPNFGSRIATPTASGHRRNLSNISTGSVRGRLSVGGYDSMEKMQTSPRLDDEGRQLASKRFATEKRNYSRLDRLNAELQGLIRQGQEALGTTVDVDMEDEGWEEDA